MIQVPLCKPDLPDFATLKDEFREVLESGKITNFGKYVSAFEREARAFLDAEVVTVSSGTAGLILALQASGLQPGDKVILPSFTFMATAQAVLYADGIPLFADINHDLTLSTEDLETLLSRHDDVAVVLPVHTFGLPARTDEIQVVVDRAAQKRSKPISVLYDAAHAFGSARGNRRIGTFGKSEIFSLSATKVLVGVEGGIVSSRDLSLIERIRYMRNYGMEAKYQASWPGLNGKMSEFHALIGLHNLRRLPELISERQRKARYYLNKIQTKTSCDVLRCPADVTHTFKDFVVLLPRAQAHRRDEIMAFLKQRGIETRAYFDPPLHQQDFFRRFADRPLPHTEAAARRVMSLPFYTTITETEIDYVVHCLAEAQIDVRQSIAL
jgi:dTDP-4-amino-4,6-dideoxygalactose transaminase